MIALRPANNARSILLDVAAKVGNSLSCQIAGHGARQQVHAIVIMEASGDTLNGE